MKQIDAAGIFDMAMSGTTATLLVIYIRFAFGEKKFLYPSCFEQGYFV